MNPIKVGVGELVSFLYASGDLSSETFQNVSLIEGTKAHQYLQSKYQSSDEAEIQISYLHEGLEYPVLLSGRMDGLLTIDGEKVIEEIKSTRTNIFDESFSYNKEHLAQLKMYAYMYMKNHELNDIFARITYIQLGDYQIRHFDQYFELEDLHAFFMESMENYMEWMKVLILHEMKKMETLHQMVFPFDTYRRGQREMMAAVYQTMMEDDILYSIAPTGIGKTMASLFASLKALHENTQKIFYLTAKTVGKQVALDSMDMLHEGGLETKTLEITSKDTICFLDKRECDPEKCIYAKGFFDRLQGATKDIFENEKLMRRDVIERYAKKHTICPFEFSLNVSYYVDVIVADYNYVFDPRTHLIRYFDENNYKPLLLVDEAHNLVSRSRDMYSSTLLKSELITLRRLGSKLKPTIRNAVNKVIDIFDSYEEQLSVSPFISFKNPNHDFLESLRNLLKKIDNSLKENPKYAKKTDIIESYLSVLGFVRISEFYDDTYLTNVEKKNEDIELTIQCLDASAFILDTVKNKAYGSVFFSATLYPIDYYQTLLTQKKGETLKIKSPFNPDHLKVIVMNQISTRYHRRTASIQAVVDTISTVLSSKKGNYIVFFPSYQYLNQILAELPKDIPADLIIQEKEMDSYLRDTIIERFRNESSRSQLALFVMGGMFAEGIDYIGDMLNGVIIVGVGLPMINEPNNQLKDYYQTQFEKGFDYAYTYPGMNKVIQAVGRVIRTDTDYGIAILIDDRFDSTLYKSLYPQEWKKHEIINQTKKLKPSLDLFWNSMKK